MESSAILQQYGHKAAQVIRSQCSVRINLMMLPNKFLKREEKTLHGCF